MVSVNAQVLQDLADLSPSGSKFVVTLIEKFFKTGPAQIQKMKEELSHSDFIAVRKTAHYFKSSAGNLGAMKLSEFCNKIQNLKDPVLDTDPRLEVVVPVYLEQIEKEWKKVENELKLELLKQKADG